MKKIKRISKIIIPVFMAFVLFLLAVLPVFASNGSLGFYATTTKSAYTLGMLQNDILYLQQNYPDKIKYSEIGKSVNDQPIYQIILGDPDAEHAYFVQSSMHSREYINSQITMALIENFVKQDLKDTCFYILPMVNPDGIAICQAGNKSYKANANGVDINRNFPIGWDVIAETPAPGQYKGKAPLTEPESVALKVGINQRKFDLNINYHSKGNVIYYTSLWASKEVQDASSAYAQIASKATGYTPIVCDGSSEGGTFADYVASELKIPYITIENGSTGCPVKQSEFSGLLNKNIVLWTALIK